MDIESKLLDSQKSDIQVETDEAKVLLSQTDLHSDKEMMKVFQPNKKYLRRDSTISFTKESSDCMGTLVYKNEQCVSQGTEHAITDKTVESDEKEQTDFSGKPTKSNTCENCGQAIKKDSDMNSEKRTSVSISKSESSLFSQGQSNSREEFCRICHCEGDSVVGPLIAPCNCKGTLEFIHQSCLQQWIKSSDYRHCELCGFHFAMNTKLKPLMKWEKLSMSTSERRKILCSVMFHIIAITCVIWSLQVLIERTAKDLKQGELLWPFWTKLIVVAIGFTGGLVFMYVQCKVYVLLWNRLKAFNRIIYVQDQPKSSVSPCKLSLNNTVPQSTAINNSSGNIQASSSHQDFVIVVELSEQRESSL